VAVEQDIWIVGAPEVNCGRDVDRVTFAVLGLPARAAGLTAQQIRQILDALAGRYGMNVQATRANFTVEASPRSREGEAELIAHPTTMPVGQAMGFVSPARAES
jgi:hypothetical protein